MKFFALVTQHSQKDVQMEGWGGVGEGFGAGGWGTVKKMGVPSNANLFFIYLFILFYEMRI